jgi:predicted nucleotidyltransferase
MHLEETIADYFKANSAEITAVYIFGSQASGRSLAGSDVDIGVLFDRNDADYIRSRIEKFVVQLPRLLKKDVHPLAINFAGEVLLKQIFAKGKCLLVTDLRKFAEFKMVAYARIAGFDYYLKKMQAGLIRRVLEAAPSG